MRKILLVYLWLMYILAAPFIILFWLGYTIYYLIDMRKYGVEFSEIKDLWKAYVKGLKLGHEANMCNVNNIFSDEGVTEEEGLN